MFPETGAHARQKRAAAHPVLQPSCHRRESRQGGGGSGSGRRKPTAAAPSPSATAAIARPTPASGRFPPNRNGRATSLHCRIRELVGVSLVWLQRVLLASVSRTNSLASFRSVSQIGGGSKFIEGGRRTVQPYLALTHTRLFSGIIKFCLVLLSKTITASRFVFRNYGMGYHSRDVTVV